MINNLKINQLFIEAIQLYNEKKLYLSKKKYEEIIVLDPQNLQSFNNLGLIYKNLGEIDKSINFFKKAIEIDPNYQNAYNNLGIVLLEKGEYLKAIENFKKLIEINPNQYAAYCNLDCVMKKQII